MIIKIFFAGMLITIPAIYIETFLDGFLSSLPIPHIVFLVVYFFLGIALVEEFLKYLVPRIGAFSSPSLDEPLEIMLYMVISAWGFAALENTFFILNPLSDGNVLETLLTGNLRFLGATLLHTLSSATIGGAIALSFYKKISIKRIYVGIGVILSILLHTLFNLFIMNSNGEKALIVFLFVWLGIILLILFFEKIKRIKNPKQLFIK